MKTLVWGGGGGGEIARIHSISKVVANKVLTHHINRPQ